ncbi:hypothetical protein ACTNCM_12835, partial [Candidatus Merdisoma sp. HCP28S3_H6]|uniref:hypothetical protein n=1 Tax=Candidatus Merdisoma sp. HCP28S3_H6 TaxID=3438870 RepID=UPI003F88E96A
SDLCEWPVDMSCFPPIPEGNEDVARLAVDTATEILWALTGRQFGVCPAVYHPGVEQCLRCEPTLWRGEWFNVDVSTAECMRIVLPGPVFEVTRVELSDGSDGEFAVSGDAVVVRGARPTAIHYQRGIPAPPSAGFMVGRLAAERYLQCVDSGRCRLPKYATQVTRQGVSVHMADPAEVIGEGLTGLPEVDSWIRSVNPNALAEDSEVLG